nr:UDP-glucuronic acid decarboxylase 4-like [Ipomoea batatas]
MEKCFFLDLKWPDHKTNVMGTLNMLGLAKRVGARFLLTSTSEVYGDPLEHPQTETYWGNVNPIGVRSCYDEGKRTAETLTMDYHRGLNIEVRIARIFNTYGPRMCLDDGRVVSNFVAQALRKESMTVYGDGKQTRSFQYVSDLVEGLIRLMEGDHVGPFNLGNPGEFTMLELAKVHLLWLGVITNFCSKSFIFIFIFIFVHFSKISLDFIISSPFRATPTFKVYCQVRERGKR